MNLEMFFNSFIGCIMVILVGNKIFNKKIKEYELIDILLFLFYTIFLTVNDYNPDRMLKTYISFVMLLFLYKKIYKCEVSKAIAASFIFYILIFTSEVIIGGLITIISEIVNYNLINWFMHSFILNILIFSMAYLLLNILKNKINQLLYLSDKHSEKGFLVMMILTLIAISIILNKVSITNWYLDVYFYLNIICIIILLAIIYSLVRQRYMYNKFLEKYKQIVDYYNLTDEVLEEYRLKMHEYKNQLAIIKSLTQPKNIELLEYLDNLIEKNQDSKYLWVNQVKYITLPGLKGLLNYKITQFNSLNIRTNIIISEELKNFSFDELSVEEKDNLYTIVGVYLDNAMESSLESADPQINIDISKVDNSIKFTIANTYSGKIVLENIDAYKYSTKGKDRGIGLYLVKRIVDKSNKITVDRKLTDKYYIQNLYIK